MAKLQCNVCGGSLAMQPDGNSVCENCGMIYKPEVVKQMAAEITGTVKVDGEVKVAGISDADKFAKNGETFLKLGEFDKAGEVYKKMIDQFTDDYRGWWGMFLVKTRILTLNPYKFEDYYKKALVLAVAEVQSELKKHFNDCADKFCKKLEMLRDGTLAKQISVKYLFYCFKHFGEENCFVIRYDGKLSRPCPSTFGKAKNREWIARDWVNIEEKGHCVYTFRLDDHYETPDLHDLWLLTISDDLHEILTSIDTRKTVSSSEFKDSLRTLILRESVSFKFRDYEDKSSSCYIATAIYGSYDAPEVLTLRRFRDEVLSKSSLGRKFIAFYYKHSPRYAEKLKTHRRVNRAVKFFLDRLVKLIEKRRPA